MQKSKKMRKSKYSPSYGPYGIWIPLVEEAGSLPLETVRVVINDEDVLCEIIDVIERAKGNNASKDGPSAMESKLAENEASEDEQQKNYYRDKFINLVGKVNVIALEFILTDYATRKVFFNGVLRRSEPQPDEAIRLNKFGKKVKALSKSLHDLDQNGLLDQAGFSIA